MIRKIIHIDRDKCNGCGLCAKACHEGAIEVINGKAVLTRDDYCDGFGDCLPNCPTGAITFEEREAAAYDEAAVAAHKREKEACASGGCPGAQARSVKASCLANWPTQIKLMPFTAPYYAGAKLLVAADCTAFAYASMHEEFMRGRITMNGCPKLDMIDYTEKLTRILEQNDIRELVLVRMEVPCCGVLENAARRALEASGKAIPFRVEVISVDGRVLDR